jgi:hypothetical protein
METHIMGAARAGRMSFRTPVAIPASMALRSRVLPVPSSSQTAHILHAQAARYVEAQVATERFARRRGMQEHGVAVRHVAAHEAKRIARARLLPVVVVQRPGARSVGTGSWDCLSLRERLHALLCAHVADLLSIGNDMSSLMMVGGGVPFRLRFTMVDAAFDRGRGLLRLTNDDGIAPAHDINFDGLDRADWMLTTT